ncbi:MAG: serine/threonine-protein kinase [Bacteroidota bacterium]
MTPPDHHARLTALFVAALDQPAESRTRWLTSACDDSALQAEVRALLAAHESPEEGLLDGPALMASETDPLIGRHVGPWKVVGLLGRGGMGSVYHAERTDETFDQHAALKLVRPGFESDFRARFLRERAVLAALDHPGIARLLDGGMTSHGTPYLAMELVVGDPITTHVEAHGHGIHASLRLFLEACRAVAYAHRRLVVHRDLKPDHVIVASGLEDTRQGAQDRAKPTSLSVKLLDFGVAKLLDDESTSVTRTGMGPLTPAYAAPEQLLGHPVTTATDVYALGVILYELMTGQRPYDLRGATAAEAERLVTGIPPRRPSEAAAPGRARQLRGDLDAILLKALEKEPERRYESAGTLADDIEQFLQGLPVRARPATATYRVGRFVRRHRVGTGLTLGVVAGLSLLVAAFTFRLADERNEAREQAQRAEAVAAFLEQILRAPNTRWYNENEATGPATPIRAVLDEAALRIDRDFQDQPDLRADLHHVIGDTYVSLGLIAEAKPHHLTVLALRESLYTPPHPKIAEALYYANGYLADGDRRRALQISERTLAMMRDVGGGNNFPFLAHGLGRSYREAGQLDQAEAVLREGFGYAEHAFVPDHEGYRYRSTSMLALSRSLAEVLLDQGQPQEAGRWITIADSLLAHLPRRAAYHGPWQKQMCVQGRWLRMQNRYPEAEQALLSCIGDGPPRGLASPFPQRDGAEPVAISGEAYVDLVALYEAWGRPEDAAPYRASATRFTVTRDSLRQVYAGAE